MSLRNSARTRLLAEVRLLLALWPLLRAHVPFVLRFYASRIAFRCLNPATRRQPPRSWNSRHFVLWSICRPQKSTLQQVQPAGYSLSPVLETA